MTTFLVKWYIKNRYYPHRRGQRTIAAKDECCARLAIQMDLAQELVVHAAMVVPYRVIPVASAGVASDGQATELVVA